MKRLIGIIIITAILIGGGIIEEIYINKTITRLEFFATNLEDIHRISKLFNENIRRIIYLFTEWRMKFHIIWPIFVWFFTFSQIGLESKYKTSSFFYSLKYSKGGRYFLAKKESHSKERLSINLLGFNKLFIQYCLYVNCTCYCTSYHWVVSNS